MKKIFAAIISLVILFSTASCILAENNPTSVSNNKFGIHISDERDLQDAGNLVNSSGGDWGYVTFVITEGQRDRGRWQQLFDQARRLHLIPIVRIATTPSGDTWNVPRQEEIGNWVTFLNSLNWVIQNRYVIIGNEPNHANEWGGSLDPGAYANYLKDFSDKLHQSSSDYFVLPAGLDASAKNSKDTMDEGLFLRKMIAAVPDVFSGVNGWASHSYPNPDFAGKVTDKGRGSIETYKWELSYLNSLGISANLPVFITETGWSNEKVDMGSISSMYDYAFKFIWSDPEVVAVTPFIFNYPDPPFAQFSWKKKDGGFYPYYEGYKNIQKIKGTPIQLESGQILGAFAQPFIVTGSDFLGIVLVKNTGQSIWNGKNINIVSDDPVVNIKNNLLFDIEPLRTGLIVFRGTTTQSKGVFIKSLYLTNEAGKRITNSFPIEALMVSVNRMQIQDIFDKLLRSIR